MLAIGFLLAIGFAVNPQVAERLLGAGAPHDPERRARRRERIVHSPARLQAGMSGTASLQDLEDVLSTSSVKSAPLQAAELAEAQGDRRNQAQPAIVVVARVRHQRCNVLIFANVTPALQAICRLGGDTTKPEPRPLRRLDDMAFEDARDLCDMWEEPPWAGVGPVVGGAMAPTSTAAQRWLSGGSPSPGDSSSAESSVFGRSPELLPHIGSNLFTTPFPYSYGGTARGAYEPFTADQPFTADRTHARRQQELLEEPKNASLVAAASDFAARLQYSASYTGSEHAAAAACCAAAAARACSRSAAMRAAAMSGHAPQDLYVYSPSQDAKRKPELTSHTTWRQTLAGLKGPWNARSSQTNPTSAANQQMKYLV